MAELTKNHRTTQLLKFLSRQPLQISRFIARGLAALVRLLHLSKTSQTIRLNLQIAFPELSSKEREQIFHHAIRNELSAYFEFFSIWGAENAKNIARIEHIYGENELKDALNSTTGLVLIVPHFGTWEIMNAYIAQFTRMTIMYKPVKNAAANQFVLAARSREQAHLVPTDESGVRQIFKALKQGGTTVILPDHTPAQGGEMIPYFGLPLASSNLSAKLIQKTKAKALMLYAKRNDNGLFDMYVEPIAEAIYQGTANEGTEIIHQHLEDLIRRDPTHYHWSYKRFRAHPELRRLYDIPVNEALDKVRKLREQSIPLSTQPPH